MQLYHSLQESNVENGDEWATIIVHFLFLYRLTNLPQTEFLKLFPNFSTAREKDRFPFERFYELLSKYAPEIVTINTHQIGSLVFLKFLKKMLRII